MPNPRANRPLTLDQVTADLQELSQPAFYPRVGNIRARGMRPPQPIPMQEQAGPAMPQWGDYDLSVPTQANRAMSQRMVEQDALESARASANMSPLEKAGAAMQAARLVGSGLTQLVMSMPTRIRSGDKAADEYIAENIYQPTIPKATEYVGDFGEMMEQLETKYKIPPIMPELLPFQEMTGPAMRQISRTAPRAAGATGLGGLQMADQGFAGGGLLKGIKAARKGAPNAERSMPARGALRFADEPVGGPSVIKEKGGNWVGGVVAGNVDRMLNQFKTPTVAGETPAQRIPKHEALLQDPTLNQDQIDRVLYQLEATKGEAAVDQWIANNVGNYIKKDMATPTDPVRLMFERRAQEIEARFQADMNRAQRTRARAEAETDPRRQANLTRQAAQQEEQAKFDRDFATEHITHLPKDEWGELSNPSEELMQKRLREGFQMLGDAKSDPAQRWENLTDEAIDINRAGDIQKQEALYEKAKEATRAYEKIFNEIDEKFPVEFKKILKEKGLNFSDEDFMAAIKSIPLKQQAETLGLSDELVRLRNAQLKSKEELNIGLQDIGDENPWIAKIDPETNIYSAYTGDLGIDHVIDVIRQDVAAGRIRPEQLNKLSMDQAIQRTAEFNMEQAKKMRDTAIKQTEGMPVHKEYSDEGYKWIELRQPEAKLEEGHYIIQDKPSASNWKVVPHPDGEGYALRADNGQMALDGRGIAERKWNSPQEAKGSIAEYAEIQEPYPDEMFRIVDQSGNTISVGATEKEALKLYKRQERDQQLAEALKYEGDTMGHCVGGYCPDVLEGRTRIYSLRDKRGEPHVTVEVQSLRGSELGRYAADLPEGEDVAAMKNPPQKIVQIKGKGNARPVEKYDPYTQDFVRSGNWSDVGDLKNTGLVKYEGKYMTQAEADDMLYQQLNKDVPGITDELGLTPPPEGMKRGGSVHISDNPDTMMMELGDRHFQVGGIVDAAARAAKAAKAAQLKKAMKASEALAQIEGKNLNITQADRTKVGEGLLGGPGFSGLQLQEGPHKQSGAVWGVKNPGTAKTMLGGLKNPLGNEYFTTMIGSPTQHQSNQMVFDKLYSKFKSEAKKGNLDPELQQKINERLASAVDKDGNPVFPPDVDILSKDFKKIANTFDRRSIAGNLIGGVGVGGRKGQIIDYDKIIRDTTDPFLLDMPSGSLGHRLWTPSGEIIERPDLHPAFPAIATGEDLGVEFTPAAQDILMAPWIENVRQTKGRNPGYMDWTRGRPPSVRVSDEILRNLEESGNKEGGAITVKPKRDGQKFKPGKKPDVVITKKPEDMVMGGNQSQISTEAFMSAGGKLSKVALEAIQRMKAMRPEIAAKSSLEQKALAENTAKYARDIQPFSMTDEEVAAEMKRLESKGMAGGGAINADDLILEERPL